MLHFFESAQRFLLRGKGLGCLGLPLVALRGALRLGPCFVVYTAVSWCTRASEAAPKSNNTVFPNCSSAVARNYCSSTSSINGSCSSSSSSGYFPSAARLRLVTEFVTIKSLMMQVAVTPAFLSSSAVATAPAPAPVASAAAQQICFP